MRHPFGGKVRNSKEHVSPTLYFVSATPRIHSLEIGGTAHLGVDPGYRSGTRPGPPSRGRGAGGGRSDRLAPGFRRERARAGLRSRTSVPGSYRLTVKGRVQDAGAERRRTGHRPETVAGSRTRRWGKSARRVVVTGAAPPLSKPRGPDNGQVISGTARYSICRCSEGNSSTWRNSPPGWRRAQGETTPTCRYGPAGIRQFAGGERRRGHRQPQQRHQPAAQRGCGGGIQGVDVVFRSGIRPGHRRRHLHADEVRGNNFHGSAYEFLRSNVTTARTFFAGEPPRR